MPIRNPFARRPGGAPAFNDENLRPEDPDAAQSRSSLQLPGFERVDTVGSGKASSAVSVRSGKSQDNGEYKMSVVNDSGVYLPPSPTEKEASWGKRYLSRNSTETRSSMGDIEPFSISRESFDSYRRSFDISAKSPVIVHDPQPRQSLDSRFPRFPRSSFQDRRFDRELPPTDEHFEDVGLNDDKQHQQPKKRGFFSKFGSEHSNTPEQASGTPSPGMSRFLMSAGRKRGQSGQGAELGQIERPKTAEQQEVQS